MKTQNSKRSHRVPSSKRTKPLPPPPSQASPRATTTPAETCRWLKQARDLPDVRWEKVTAVRDALANGQYDVEGLLENLLHHFPGAPASAESDNE